MAQMACPTESAPAEGAAAAAAAAAPAAGCAGFGFCSRVGEIKPVVQCKLRVPTSAPPLVPPPPPRPPGAPRRRCYPLPELCRTLCTAAVALLACLPGSLGANLGLAGPALAASLSSFDKSKFMLRSRCVRRAGPPLPAPAGKLPPSASAGAGTPLNGGARHGGSSQSDRPALQAARVEWRASAA